MQPGKTLTAGAGPVLWNVVERTSGLRSGFLAHRFGNRKPCRLV